MSETASLNERQHGSFELFTERAISKESQAVCNGNAKGLQVCLVTALTIADFIDPELTANAGQFMAGSVGVLTLAAILREKSLKPAVVNLDCLYLEFLGSDNGKVPNDFFQFVTQRLALQSFDVFGFSSICSSYPLTLRLAQHVKNLFPNAQVVLGGPQASVVDQTTMRAFPCIDFVLRGEADDTFADLLRVLASRRESSALEEIRGLTFRRDNEVVRNHNATVVENLDVLPLPAFDLDPDLKRRGSIYLELGRGCPFACTFCSTNDFFRRNFRLKSPWKMIHEMEQVKAETGIANFSLIHDMFTVDRKRVVAFCDALLACKDRFTWACSARTDCVDDALIERMADAGCRGIFFGIETGSERLQRKIRKDLNLEEAIQRIECADRLGIKTAVALITAFPDETYEDLRDTIHFFVDSSRFDHAEPQLSLLAPLAGTPLHDAYKDELILDCVFSDMSHQGWQQDPADLEMIKRYPDVFPNFYAIPTSSVPRRYFKEVRDFVAFLTSWFRWLPVALLQDSGDLLTVFDRWKEWREQRQTSDSDYTPYYCRRRCRDDFLEFVESLYIPEWARARTAMKALLQVEGVGGIHESFSVATLSEDTEVFDEACFPYPARDLTIVRISVNYTDLVQRLRRKQELQQVLESPSTIAFRKSDERRTEVWELSQSSDFLLSICDGKRTLQEIKERYVLAEPYFNEIPGEQTCLFGLMLLKQDALIGISRVPVTVTRSVKARENEATPICYSPPPQASNTQRPWPWPPSRA